MGAVMLLLEGLFGLLGSDVSWYSCEWKGFANAHLLLHAWTSPFLPCRLVLIYAVLPSLLSILPPALSIRHLNSSLFPSPSPSPPPLTPPPLHP